MIRRRARRWFQVSGATAEEVEAVSPADELSPDAPVRWVRCVTVAAPHHVVYRWLCQLTIAPYSYDLIDFPGRKSPERLIPGAEDIRVGQDFLICAIADFEKDRFISGRSLPRFHKAFGQISVSYWVRPVSPTRTRLQANMCLDGLSGFRAALLAVGDAIMAGHQLRRLKRRAEQTYDSGLDIHPG